MPLGYPRHFQGSFVLTFMHSSLAARVIKKSIRPIAKYLWPMLPGSSVNWGPPRRFSSSYSRWLANVPPETQANLVPVIPELQFLAASSVTSDTKLPKNLSFPASIKLEQQFVAEMPGGRVVGSRPAIISSDDTIIGELSMMFAPFFFDIFYAYKLPSILKVSGPVLVLAGEPGSNYGHWLHQMLPRVYLAQKAGWKPHHFSKVVINPTPNGFAEQSLLEIGFLKQQLVEVSPSLHIQGDPLVVPSIPLAGNPPEWISQFLRQAYCATATESKPTHKIYTSRANARWRRISNEDALLPVLEEFGFEIVYPEQLDFLEGAKLFENASVVCGMHGANLSNICFCKPGSTVIEIYNPQHPEIYFWVTATGASLRYCFLLGEGPIRDFPDLSPKSIGNHIDTIVDPQKLRNTFLAAGLTPINRDV